MVQKCVLLPTAPKTKASANAPHTTPRQRCRLMPSRRFEGYGGREAVRRATCFFVARRFACSPPAGGIFLARVRSVSRAAGLVPAPPGSRDVEQRIGRLGILRPELDHSLLCRRWRTCNRAWRSTRCRSSTAPRGRSSLLAKLVMNLEARDGELIVPSLNWLKRQLVACFFRGGAALALAQLSCQRNCVCSSFLAVSRST